MLSTVCFLSFNFSFTLDLALAVALTLTVTLNFALMVCPEKTGHLGGKEVF